MPLIAELVADQTEWGTDEPERPVVLVAHGGLIAALTAALLKLPVDNWPALGGMGNASWVQLSGHSDRRRGIRRYPVAARCMERLGTGRQRCPLTGATLLVFCDSLSYYGPTGGLPSDDPRIWPNIVAGHLGWDVELIGRIGWTCRDVWWAATQDPRCLGGAAAGRRCHLRDLWDGLAALAAADRAARAHPLRAPVVASALGARRLRLGAAQILSGRAGRTAAARLRRVSRADPRRNRFQPAGHSRSSRRCRRCTSPRRTARRTAAGRARSRRSPNGQSNTTFRWST